MGLIIGHGRNRNQIAAGLIISLDHVRETRPGGMMQHVRQEQREGFVADEFAGAPHGVAKAKRGLLAGKTGLTGAGEIASQQIQFALFAALAQGLLELELAVEMVFDDAFVATRDENEMLDAGFARLVDDVLDDRTVNDR